VKTAVRVAPTPSPIKILQNETSQAPMPRISLGAASCTKVTAMVSLI
jgi:hypothetical protein